MGRKIADSFYKEKVWRGEMGKINVYSDMGWEKHLQFYSGKQTKELHSQLNVW